MDILIFYATLIAFAIATKAENGTSGLERHASPSSWLNNPRGPFDFKCPHGSVISEFHSEFDKKTRDRRWSFRCARSPRLDGSKNHWTKDYVVNGPIDFNCEDGGVIVGVSSPATTSLRPRRTFKFTCVSVKPRNVISCHHLENRKQLEFNSAGKTLKAKLPTDKGYGLSGIRAYFYSKQNDHHWFFRSSKWKGCTCQAGFTGEICEKKCTSYPCSMAETFTQPGEEFSFYCPPNHVVDKMAAVPDSRGNVKWAFQCRYTHLLMKNVSCETYFFTYRYAQPEAFSCPNAGLIAGFEYNKWMDPSHHTYGMVCCKGLPRNANSCQVSDVEQGPVLNPRGGSFNYTVAQKYLGIGGLQSNWSSETQARIWRPTFPDINCDCDNVDNVTHWVFLKHKMLGLVLDVTREEGIPLITLRLKNGSDSQMWTFKNGRIVNRQGYAIDVSSHARTLVPMPPSREETQHWVFKDGYLRNPSHRIYASLYGMGLDANGEEGSQLSVVNRASQFDRAWVPEPFDEEFLCRRSCYLKPCQNGGKCVKNKKTGYECNCRLGYIGKNCEENVNECLPSLCRNGAVCVDGENDYSCKCPEGFRGKDCDISIDETDVKDVRCVDVVVDVKGVMKSIMKKISLCHTVESGMEENLSMKKIEGNLVVSGYPGDPERLRYHLLMVMAFLAKSKPDYENFPLNCIRNGRLTSMEDIEAAMKTAGIRTMPETAQNRIKMAVNFFKSRVVDGSQSIVNLLKAQGETCDGEPCNVKDILSIISRKILPTSEVYDGFELGQFRLKHPLC